MLTLIHINFNAYMRLNFGVDFFRRILEEQKKTQLKFVEKKKQYQNQSNTTFNGINMCATMESSKQK